MTSWVGSQRTSEERAVVAVCTLDAVREGEYYGMSASQPRMKSRRHSMPEMTNSRFTVSRRRQTVQAVNAPVAELLAKLKAGASPKGESSITAAEVNMLLSTMVSLDPVFAESVAIERMQRDGNMSGMTSDVSDFLLGEYSQAQSRGSRRSVLPVSRTSSEPERRMPSAKAPALIIEEAAQVGGISAAALASIERGVQQLAVQGGASAAPLPPLPAGDDLSALMATFDEWGFDVFAADRLTDGGALSVVGHAAFISHNLLSFVEQRALAAYLTLVTTSYRNNPYHNAVHAADVAQ